MSQHGINGRRGTRTTRDSTGQLIIDQDEENLSDKEMYARNVPAIEITRESPSEIDFGSEEDYEYRRKTAAAGRVHPRKRHPRHAHTTDKEHSRVFVALFDYDPPTMSPNPEACEDELAFREGQLIKVSQNSSLAT